MGKEACKTGGDGPKMAPGVKDARAKSKKFKCEFPECMFGTAYRASLKRHLRTHESDPKVRLPFPCIVAGCSYRASQKSNLESHIRSMHDENHPKPLVVCPLCSAAFHDKKSLRDHLNGIHVKDSAFTCSKCDFRSFFVQHFWTHLKTEHGEGNRKFDGPNAAAVTVGPALDSKIVLSQRDTNRKLVAEISQDDHDIWGDSLRIFQCTLCNFIAKDEEEALNHSTLHKDPLVSSRPD